MIEPKQCVTSLSAASPVAPDAAASLNASGPTMGIAMPIVPKLEPVANETAKQSSDASGSAHGHRPPEWSARARKLGVPTSPTTSPSDIATWEEREEREKRGGEGGEAGRLQRPRRRRVRGGPARARDYDARLEHVLHPLHPRLHRLAEREDALEHDERDRDDRPRGRRPQQRAHRVARAEDGEERELAPRGPTEVAGAVDEHAAERRRDDDAERDERVDGARGRAGFGSSAPPPGMSFSSSAARGLRRSRPQPPTARASACAIGPASRPLPTSASTSAIDASGKKRYGSVRTSVTNASASEPDALSAAAR